MSARLLVVAPAWIGDTVMAHSLIQILARRPASPSISVVAPDWTVAVVERMPEVAEIVPLPVGHGRLQLGARMSVARRLRPGRFQQAIVLPGSFKSALIPALAGVPLRTGYRGEMRYGLLNDIRRDCRASVPRTAERYAALGLAPGDPSAGTCPRPRLEVDYDSVATALDAMGMQPPVRDVIALCPGAEYGPAKRWPAEYFAEVARHEIRHDREVWMFGSDRESALAREIVDLAGPAVVDFTGRTTLAQAIDLMTLASVVVSNDSGLMHIAAALDRPVVALFGSSSPAETPPLSPDAVVVYLDLDCSPCFQRHCPLGHMRCLRDIRPGRVTELVEAALRKTPIDGR